MGGKGYCVNSVLTRVVRVVVVKRLLSASHLPGEEELVHQFHSFFH